MLGDVGLRARPRADFRCDALELARLLAFRVPAAAQRPRSEEHTSELQSHLNLVCRLLLEKKKTHISLKLSNSLYVSLSACKQATCKRQITVTTAMHTRSPKAS